MKSFSKEPISVLVIGAGMYVCGKGTPGWGTILPTLAEDQALGKVGDIWIVGTSVESAQIVSQKVRSLGQKMGFNIRVNIWPKAGPSDPNAYKKVLTEIFRPACAIVSTPDHLHAPMAEDVIRAGLPVLVVKPLAPTVAEVRRLLDVLEEYKGYGAVEFHKRFDESNLLARQAISDGRLGELLYVLVEFSQKRKIREIFGSWWEKSDIFQYLGVHYADLVHFLTGATPLSVMAIGQQGKTGSGAPPWDAIEAVVKWRRPQGQEFTSIIVTNWIDPNTTTAMSDQKILIVGDKGRYQADQKNRGVEVVTDDGVEALNPYFNQIYKDADGNVGIRGYGPASIRQFLGDAQGILDGTLDRNELNRIRPSFAQALISNLIIEAVHQSLAEGNRWVDVSAWAGPEYLGVSAAAS